MENGRLRQVLSKKHDITLSELKVGECGRIISVTGTGDFRGRLLDMGFTPETEVEVKLKAPFGDPIVLSVRGYELALRCSDADNIIIQEV